MIAALIQKDLKLFFRNRFIALISLLGLLAYIAIYFVAPDTVDAQFGIAMWVEDPTISQIDERLQAVGQIESYPSEAALTEAVEAGDHAIGLLLSADDLAAIERREPHRVRALFAPGTPADLQQSLGSVLGMALNDVQGGGALFSHLGGQEEVLGPDLFGKGLSLRDRLLPTLLLLILVVEVMGLATLIAEERERGTIRALLVTPLSVGRFFAAKTLMGAGLAFVQVLILVVLTGHLMAAPGIILVTLLLGSLFVTGLAFLIASVARDIMGVIAWGMLLLIVLAIPAFTILFPAASSGWVEGIPTFYLVDTLHRAINFDATWADVARNLAILAGSGVLSLALGSTLLQRRY